MAWKLVGKNCAIEIEPGGPTDGAPTYGTGINIKGVARRIMKEETVSEADVSALADSVDVLQPLRSRAVFDIEMLMDNELGEQLYNMIGDYIRVKYKPLSTDVAFKVFQGFISQHGVEMPDGASIERFRVTCNANGGSLPS
jgi:hypothetical protein